MRTIARRTPSPYSRALQGRVCETHPETRAGGDLKACEALPPNRCASRRSTPQASVRSLRRQHGRIVGGRTLPGRAAPHECAGWLSKGPRNIVHHRIIVKAVGSTKPLSRAPRLPLAAVLMRRRAQIGDKLKGIRPRAA